MKVHFLGTGTSQGIPVIGCECHTCTSKDPSDKRLRASIAIEYAGAHLVIDVGPDFRQQMLRAQITKLHGILLTHEHNDHVAGLDDIRPFNFRQGGKLPIFALPRVSSDLKKRFAYVFAPQRYPGAPQVELTEIQANQVFDVAGLEILALPIRHGDLDILAFRIGSFAYITDANEISNDTIELLRGSEIIVLNALHQKNHHSHFNLKQAISMAATLEAKQTYFIHMSHLMGVHSEVNRSLPKGMELANDGLVINI